MFPFPTSTISPPKFSDAYLPTSPVLELVSVLHPTPAVAGKPSEAINLIKEIEKGDEENMRGPSGGAMAMGPLLGSVQRK